MLLSIIMPGDEEERLKKELADQLKETKKWFGKVERIYELIESVEGSGIYVGGAKAFGLFGGGMTAINMAPAPGAYMSTAELISAIRSILRD